MKRIIIKYFAILSAVLLVSSCEWNPPTFDSADSFIAFTASASAGAEQGGVIGIPVLVTSVAGQPAVSVTFDFDEASVAIEGEDFTLVNSSNTLDYSNGAGYDTIWIQPIDNDVFTGTVPLIINLTSNTQSYAFGVTKSHTLNIIDDEHPLGVWIGTYSVVALSYGNPGTWDESWTVVTSAVPGDSESLSMIINTGNGGGVSFLASFDIEEMTITIGAGTEAGELYGYGPTAMYVGDWATLDIESPVVGTIEADGTIKIDKIAMILTDYGFSGGYWDAFNTTWTLAGKKAVRVYPPVDKFMLQH
jgi:hypothetical protein